MNRDQPSAASVLDREIRDCPHTEILRLKKENRLLCDKLTHVHGLLQDLEEFMTRTNNWRNLPTGGAK